MFIINQCRKLETLTIKSQEYFEHEVGQRECALIQPYIENFRNAIGGVEEKMTSVFYIHPSTDSK